MTTVRRPPGRYDERRSLPRPVLLALASLGVLALLAFAYFGYSRFSTGRTGFGLLGYQVLSDTSAEVTFEVDKPLTDTVVCAVVARDRDQVTVGTQDVTVGPGDRDPAQVTTRLTTTARAATVDVTSCSTPRGPGTP
ncbi:MAG: DUF4307 domain-containing protein [Mycobacteriales bacterium]